MNPLNRDEIWQLLCEYTQSELLRKHMLAVEAAMEDDNGQYRIERNTFQISNTTQSRSGVCG